MKESKMKKMLDLSKGCYSEVSQLQMFKELIEILYKLWTVQILWVWIM